MAKGKRIVTVYWDRRKFIYHPPWRGWWLLVWYGPERVETWEA